MFLSEVVETSSAPISEEQAWGLYYQGLKTLKSDAFSGPTDEGISFNSIFVHKDGVISFGRDTRNKSDQPKSKKMRYSEAAVLYDLGSAVYNALDYGIRADEERILGQPLENLISMMITDYLDEGVGEENEAGLSKIDSILKICKEHVPRAVNADIFYQNIISEMVTEAKQLPLVDCAWPDTGGESSGGTDPSMLQKWSKVTEEIQRGTSRLKKITEIGENRQTSVMNSHETLMFAIRNQKQQLRKVEVQRAHPKSTSTHDVTMQLIRSRPKLKPVVERHLNPTPPRRYSLRELIHKELLNRTAEWPSSEPRYRTLRRGCISGGRSSCARRLSMCSTGRKRLKIDHKLLSGNANSEECVGLGWRYRQMCTTDDMDWKSYDVESGLLGKRRLSFSDPDLNRRCFDDVDAIPEVESGQRTEPHVNLEEMLHIRTTLVRAELDGVEVDDQRLHADLISGKVCFSCKKRFGFFGNKGSACEFCERTVCLSCLNTTVVFSESSVARTQVEGAGPRLLPNARDCHVFSLTPVQSNEMAEEKRITHSFSDLSAHQETSVGMRVCKECSSLLNSASKE